MSDREPWFRASWSGWMPIHPTGWKLTFGAAAFMVVSVVTGVLLYLRTPDPIFIMAPAVASFLVIAVFLAIGLTRTTTER